MDAGEEIERDCSCDSQYMLSAMHRVGEAIRKKIFWVPKEETRYLVMDNAGGHGTNEAIDEYIKFLKADYNVTIIVQILHSPYCNVLNLGVWCALQAAVERTHYMRRCEVNALVQSV